MKDNGENGENEETKPREVKPIGKSGEADPMVAFVDAGLTIEKLRVQCIVRRSHLAKRGRVDKHTDELVAKLIALEEYVDDTVAALVKQHPAYPWFSRIKGCGRENVAKVVGNIDVTKAATASSVVKWCGYAPGHDKRVKGQKLEYNAQLRSLCWRLGAAIKKAGIRKKCYSCGALVATQSQKCRVCQADISECPIVATSRFCEYYFDEKAKYAMRFATQGYQILPTPTGGWRCANCEASWARKADIEMCCPNIQIEKAVKKEPPGVIWLGHLDAMAMRKMIKRFLVLLWAYWREAEGLPARVPYPQEYLGHDHMMKPEDMCDR